MILFKSHQTACCSCRHHHVWANTKKYNNVTLALRICNLQLPVCDQTFAPSEFPGEVAVSADVRHATPRCLHHLDSLVVQHTSHLVVR